MTEVTDYDVTQTSLDAIVDAVNFESAKRVLFLAFDMAKELDDEAVTFLAEAVANKADGDEDLMEFFNAFGPALDDLLGKPEGE